MQINPILHNQVNYLYLLKASSSIAWLHCKSKYVCPIGDSLPRKSTSDEVREHRTSLTNVNKAPSPIPTVNKAPSPIPIQIQAPAPKPTNHVNAPLVGNHTTHPAPRLATHVAPQPHSQPQPQPQPQPLKHVAPAAVPPQPAPRRLSQTNGQVRLHLALCSGP